MVLNPEEKYNTHGSVTSNITPEKKNPFYLYDYASGDKQVKTERLTTQEIPCSHEKRQLKHSALKSRQVNQVLQSKTEKVTFFELQQEEPCDIIVPLFSDRQEGVANFMESKFSIYSYSDTDEQSMIQLNNNKIELLDGGEPSITFISSKFIKSSSAHSFPDEMNPLAENQPPMSS